MNRKQHLSAITITVAAIGIVSAAMICTRHINPVFGTSSYQMSFNSSTRLTDHSNIMYTSSSNYAIPFSYNGSLFSYSDGWQLLDGEVFNTQAINGMTSLTATFTGEMEVSYGYKSNSQIYYIVTDTLTSGVPYYFDNSYPSYFRLTSVNDYVYITSIDLTYSCVNNNSVLESWGTNNLGVTPRLTGEGTFIYGMYPQVRISDETIISNLVTPKKNGMYFYNGKYYLDRVANPGASTWTFDDGSKIESSVNYWFECKPVEWQILENNSGTYKLFSTNILDGGQYFDNINSYTEGTTTIYPTDYEHSIARDYLNNEMFPRMFSLNPYKVKTVTVYNNSTTAGLSESDEKLTGEDTQDKIYLLSYLDLSSMENNAARDRTTTDFAACNMSKIGYYFSRSATGQGKGYMYGDNYMRTVMKGGSITYGVFVTAKYGYCPGITITM